MEEKVRVYYLSSGHIGIPVLEALLKADQLELVGIGSQQKSAKKSGPVRSAKSPVTLFCNEHGIDVEGYATVNTEQFHTMLKERRVQVLIVASFGQLLKPAILEIPEYGCLNIHASLLPRYRGAAPIVASLLNGDTVTGVSFMQMEEGLDTGGVYRVFEQPVSEVDTADSLEEKLGILAGVHIQEVVLDIVRNGLKPVPQSAEGSSYAKKINKEDGWIKWNRPAAELANMVRAYQPWPSARMLLPVRNGMSKMAKVTEAKAVEMDCASARPGDIISSDRNGILIACGSGALLVIRLLPEGKKEMPAKDYLLGYPIPADHPYMYDF